jgi:hypothetical protein
LPQPRSMKSHVSLKATEEEHSLESMAEVTIW